MHQIHELSELQPYPREPNTKRNTEPNRSNQTKSNIKKSLYLTQSPTLAYIFWGDFTFSRARVERWNSVHNMNGRAALRATQAPVG